MGDVRFRFLASVLGASAICACSGPTDDTGEYAGHEATTGEAILAGKRLSEAEVADHLRNAGFEERVVPQMVCTAKWESSFFSEASNVNRNGSKDIGLFQINDRTWLGPCGVTRNDLLDPATNAECALTVYQGGGLGSWYGYTSHKRECANYHRVGSAGVASPRPNTPLGAPADGAPSDDPSSDPSTADNSVTCWSPTLGMGVAEGTCVQSASNRVWYQCQGGDWVRGVDLRAHTGPAGACTEWDPL
jgi:hypothetical protein